jgi:hypothetical protein
VRLCGFCGHDEVHCTREALLQHRNNLSAAARHLGVKRTTLIERLKRIGAFVPRRKGAWRPRRPAGGYSSVGKV